MKLDFNSGWDFKLTKINVAGMDEYKEKLSGKVDLPHDFSIHLPRTPDAPGGGAVGWYPGGRGEYSNVFTLSEDETAGTVLIEFEGVYDYAEVWVNGSVAAQNYYGYSGFYADATPFVHAGENKVTVIADNMMQPNSRWYSGSGIYRRVYLHKLGRVYLNPDGVSVKTIALTDTSAKISVSAAVTNRNGGGMLFEVHYIFTDPSGTVIADETSQVKVEGKGVDYGFGFGKKVADPMKWTAETPNLYGLHIELLQRGEVVDTKDVVFGIRTVETDRERGLLINGEPVKLIGSCIHHDNGPLGACAYDSAEWAKVLSHKRRGFNAIRSAHNPPSRALLDACDRIGIYVIDEAFDCFYAGKREYDFHLMFGERWQKELAAMIRRDRCHPSVIIWSVGNEIPGIEGSSATPETAEKLANLTRRLDNTRPVTSALHALGCTGEQFERFLREYYPGKQRYEYEKQPDYGMTWSLCSFRQPDWYGKTAKYRSALDIDGLNYLDPIYADSGKLAPHSVICGTETFGEGLGGRLDAIAGMPNVIGDFVWTGADYLGESGIGKRWHTASLSWEAPYPHYVSSCGDVDICGFARTQAFYRAAVLDPDKVIITVRKPGTVGELSYGLPWSFDDSMPDWTFPGLEGAEADVTVYSGADTVELLINGESAGTVGVKDRRARFRVKYAPGTLTANAYRDGVNIASSKLRTADEPHSIMLARRDTGCPYDDLTFVEIYVIDKKGAQVTNYTGVVEASTDGGCLLTVSTGEAESTEPHGTNSHTMSRGSALAIVSGSGVLKVNTGAIEAEMKF